jgi:anti-sigma regulatory factor (Ser/Thr protein kinase)
MHFVTIGSRELQLSMAATLENIDEADARLCAFLADTEAPIDIFAVRIIFHEAMMNAVIHGSGEDPSLTVLVRARLTDQGLNLTIRDQGPGFPWRETHGDIDAAVDSGRGLPLMSIYASQVEYNDAGNQVTLFRPFTPQAEAQCAAAGGVS